MVEDNDYERALKLIKRFGGVCEEFETCSHRACNDSYTMWAIADAALNGELEQAMKEMQIFDPPEKDA